MAEVAKITAAALALPRSNVPFRTRNTRALFQDPTISHLPLSLSKHRNFFAPSAPDVRGRSNFYLILSAS
jgi:hypothetical protein